MSYSVGPHPRAELARTTEVGPGTGGAEEGLGRDAADVQAVSPHEGLLDQGDPRTEAGGDRGGDQPRGPRAQHHEVVTACRPGIRPVRGMDIPYELLIEFIVRHEGRLNRFG